MADKLPVPEGTMDEEQGKRDTAGRPVYKSEHEEKRQGEESKDKPVDPE